jgi:hypothetical protein
MEPSILAKSHSLGSMKNLPYKELLSNTKDKECCNALYVG